MILKKYLHIQRLTRRVGGQVWQHVTWPRRGVLRGQLRDRLRRHRQPNVMLLVEDESGCFGGVAKAHECVETLDLANRQSINGT